MWQVIEHINELHVVPQDDDRKHFFQACACCPQPAEEGSAVIVHNSFDGREAYENGERSYQ